MVIQPLSPETLGLNMEINFVTGKGGVGKSAVAAAMALQRARSGLRTLLVELGDQSYYRDYFDLQQVTYQPQSIEISSVKFDLAQWSGQECLREYALHILKIESLYRLFFENAVSRALVNVAPALPELSILGKITSGPPRNVGPKMPYDCLVIDSYASGHMMALLNAPKGLAAAIRFGPMGEQVHQINQIIQDGKTCHYYVVALPEELPMIEGIELSQNIQKATSLKPKILLNRMLPLSQDLKQSLNVPAEEALKDFHEYLKNLDLRQSALLDRLQQTGFQISVLPWILKSEARQITEILSQRLPG